MTRVFCFDIDFTETGGQLHWADAAMQLPYK